MSAKIAPAVFVIEDDHLLQQMYIMRLKLAGMMAYGAADIDEFHALTSKHTPRVILLDILLPKVNGIYILKEIRASERLSDAKVIILTNLHRVEIDLTPELADILGVYAYLVKSQTTPNQVLEHVQRALAKK